PCRLPVIISSIPKVYKQRTTLQNGVLMGEKGLNCHSLTDTQGHLLHAKVSRKPILIIWLEPYVSRNPKA
ncbi:hypothetical protein, partial [Holospora curviuscula]|uniref:hypothetical protein n=1 Tax=Holospora curviuscula TaxID=1082868 RepID=UPI001A9CB823